MAKTPRVPSRTLDALPDTLDFRDRMFEPTLVEVPLRIPLEEYRRWLVPVLDQGTEGACTGFGLATIAHYLLRRRAVDPDPAAVSPRMFYEMAKRYDEWPGERYAGSSARGAMKGWHKHGVCSDEAWPYRPSSRHASGLDEARVADAVRRPLGAYYRVNHRDLVAMHAAIAEVGVLYATAIVHDGWDRVEADGQVPYSPEVAPRGGHAFAVVAYDEAGLWLQNSWGPGWGADGFARVSYDDWLANGTDVWVARLGAPVILLNAGTTATAYARGSRSYVFHDLRPHIVSLGNDGGLRTDGTYGTDAAAVRDLFESDLPRLTRGWKKKRLLLYAHGGLVGEDTAVQRIADYRAAFLPEEIYPVAFVWKTDYWSTLANILQDALRRRRPEAFLDAAKDFMLDRLDDALEPLARLLTGKAQWDEMKENAQLATTRARGGARIAARHIARIVRAHGVEVHVAGHSAGSIFLAPLVERLTSKGAGGHGLTLASCTLWAPACTVDLFRGAYWPAIQKKAIRRFSLFTLTDDAERDDHCVRIYNKSLLYLVSHAFEDEPRIPLFRGGQPLLGMEKFVKGELAADLRRAGADWVLAPNDQPVGSPAASRARAHGAFDDDEATLKATMARILSVGDTAAAPVTIHRSAASARDRRQRLASIA